MANGKPIIGVDEEKALESNKANAKSSSTEEHESLDVDPSDSSEIAEEDEELPEYSPNEPMWIRLKRQRLAKDPMEFDEGQLPPTEMLRNVIVPFQPKLFTFDDTDYFKVEDDDSINSFGQPEVDKFAELTRLLEELQNESLSSSESGEEYDSHESDDDANKD